MRCETWFRKKILKGDKMGMFLNMAKLLEERQIGDWKLEHFTVDSKNWRARIDGITPGTYVRLLHGWECVMSDTNMEKRTNMDFCINAHGDILIGGLGIGMIILAIQDNPEVKSITVIEKNQEVIDMVASQLNFNEKVKIVCADVFEWEPKPGFKYDVSYMDIWSWINKDIYEREMKPLKRKYSRFLRSKKENPNRYNKCWAEYQARTGRRLA